MTRVLWWLVASGRPEDRWDVIPVLFIFALALLGALIIGWPWIAADAPGAVSSFSDTLARGWVWLTGTLQRGASALPRP
ncbi:MAG: hypothetical protein IT307_15795 [Chloroflexi bacterium]|nr:hypothetical protein [Chloroflexota bacterium]